MQSASDNVVELYALHRLESTAECSEFIHSLLADTKYHFHVGKCKESGVRSPNPMQRESKAYQEWLASTLLHGGSNLMVYKHQILTLGK
jgi:hypothetical protein